MEVKMHLDDQYASKLGAVVTPKVKNVFYDATQLDKEGRYPEAAQIYNSLLDADFNNPVILAALGMNYAAREKNGLGYSLLMRSLSMLDGMEDGFKRLGVVPKAERIADMPTFLVNKKSEILNAIGTCFKHENKTEEARKHFEQAQSLIPINPDIQNNLATLYINEGLPEKALSHLDIALAISPDHPQARWNKSLVLLELGDYTAGWDLYDCGFPAKVRAERNYSSTPLPVWDGTPDKTVVVYGEQGIGDEIMFASCLPDLMKMSKQVVFDCHKKLHSLFHSSFPDLDIYPTREDEVITWPRNTQGVPRYNFDARVAIGSLPKFFRKDTDDFPGTPYITPGKEKTDYWAKRLAQISNKPKIGIHWIGGHKRTRVDVRSMALEQLLPVLRQDATFVSLQYTPDCAKEIADFSAKYGIPIQYFPESTHSNDYEDTAALVQNLDLVITVCTSVVHLAGSMGIPCWVMTPSRPAWRYRLDIPFMPWYGKTVTLYRQLPESTDWAPVVAEISNDLSELLSVVKK